MSPTFAEIVDRVRELDTESKHELMELMRVWMVEERREEILRHGQEAEAEHAQGLTKHGTVDDLMADLYAKD
jgi:hypothetical protein